MRRSTRKAPATSRCDRDFSSHRRRHTKRLAYSAEEGQSASRFVIGQLLRAGIRQPGEAPDCHANREVLPFNPREVGPFPRRIPRRPFGKTRIRHL